MCWQLEECGWGDGWGGVRSVWQASDGALIWSSGQWRAAEALGVGVISSSQMLLWLQSGGWLWCEGDLVGADSCGAVTALSLNLCLITAALSHIQAPVFLILGISQGLPHHSGQVHWTPLNQNHDIQGHILAFCSPARTLLSRPWEETRLPPTHAHAHTPLPQPTCWPPVLRPSWCPRGPAFIGLLALSKPSQPGTAEMGPPGRRRV